MPQATGSLTLDSALPATPPTAAEMAEMWDAIPRPDPDGWSEDELTAHRHSLRIAQLMHASIYEEAA